MDPLFTVKNINATPAPQGLIYRALHQDYSEKFIGDESIPDEARCGEIAVQRLLRGDRGHFGCLEHPAISFAVGWFPHSVMQQARTHRTGVTFDVQSGRYSGQRIVDLAGRIWKDAEVWNDSDIMRDDDWPAWVEEVFYLRPAGDYSDRQGRDIPTLPNSDTKTWPMPLTPLVITQTKSIMASAKNTREVSSRLIFASISW